MNNSSALLYLVKTKIWASIRNQFKSASRIIITLVLLGLTIWGFISNIKNVETVNVLGLMADHFILNLFLAFFILIIFGIMLFNKKTALVMGNDANYIFAGPFRQKQITHYLFLSSLKDALTLSLMFVIYVLIFFNKAIMGPAHFLGLLLSVIIHYFLIISYFNYHYLFEASKDEPKRINRWLFWASLGIILVFSCVIAYGVFQKPIIFENLLKDLTSHPLFQWIPFIGSSMWISNCFLIKDITAIIPIALLIGIGVYYYYKTLVFKGDYYEKVITDAEFVTSQVNEMKNKSLTEIQNSTVDSSQLNQKNIQIDFKSGAMAIFSKNELIAKKRRKKFPFAVLPMIMMVLFGLVVHDFNIFLMALVWMVFFKKTQYDIEGELNHAWTYLIPDYPLKKIMAIALTKVRIPFLNAFVAGVVTFVLYRESLLTALALFLALVVVELMSLAIELFILRVFNFKVNMIIEMYAGLLVYILSFVPAGAAVFIVYNFFLVTDIALLILIFAGVSLVMACLIIYLSKDVMNGNVKAE